jgi:hypothetical protein
MSAWYRISTIQSKLERKCQVVYTKFSPKAVLRRFKHNITLVSELFAGTPFEPGQQRWHMDDALRGKHIQKGPPCFGQRSATQDKCYDFSKT